MKKKLRTLLPILVFSLLLFGCEQSSEIVGPELDGMEAETGPMDVTLGKNPPATPVVGTLYAGQHTPVGTLYITADNGDVVITYDVDDPWCLTETHLYLGEEGTYPPGAPKKGIPGQYPYHTPTEVNGCDATFRIPLSEFDDGDGKFVVSAHGVVHSVTDVSDLSSTLPSMAFLTKLKREVDPGDALIDSYFNGVISGGTSLDGIHDMWCIDTDRGITQGDPVNYKVFPYSSYDPDIISKLVTIPADNDDTYENLPKVNWLLNQDLSGYTYGEIQKAIWLLLDPTRIAQFAGTLKDPGGTGVVDDTRVNTLVSMANEHGDFVPGCGELVVIVLVPYDWVDGELGDKRQILIMTIPVPCGGDETAWAYGAVPDTSDPINAFEKSWGWYFTYDLTP